MGDGYKYQVVKATRRQFTPELDGEKMPFSGEGFLRVTDEGKAKELEAKYDHDLTVTKMRYPHVSDRGHRYFFGSMPEMPWKRGQNASKNIRENVSEPQGSGELHKEEQTEHRKP